MTDEGGAAQKVGGEFSLHGSVHYSIADMFAATCTQTQLKDIFQSSNAASMACTLEAHTRRCYGLLKDDGLRAAQALAVKLERGAPEDGFTLRDVRRNQWRSLTTDDAIQAAGSERGQTTSIPARNCDNMLS